MTRPRNEERSLYVCLRMKESLVRRVETISDAYGVGKSTIIRDVLDKYLSTYEQEHGADLIRKREAKIQELTEELESLKQKVSELKGE